MPWYWFLLSVCGYLSSLGKYKDNYIEEPPPLLFPLQQLRDHGRALTVAFLGILLLVAFLRKRVRIRSLLPLPIVCLIAIQFLFFAKIIFGGGNVLFALQAAVVFSMLVLMHVVGPARWLIIEMEHKNMLCSIAWVGVFFILAALYQCAVDSSAMFVSGRFLGTTGNPQHAAVLIMAVVPAVFFMVFSNKKAFSWSKYFWIAVLLILIFGLFATASRTGVMMAVVCLAVFFRGRMRVFFSAIFLLCAILFIASFFFDSIGNFWKGDFFLASKERIIRGANTRTAAWGGLWGWFMQYPVFGAPLGGAERFGFGESSWLAVAATLGIAGLIPLAVCGISTWMEIISLLRLSKLSSDQYLLCSAVAAGLLALLVGSISEAYLLGILTFPIFAFMQYLVLARYIIQKKTAD